jgi:hypothetical protein
MDLSEAEMPPFIARLEQLFAAIRKAQGPTAETQA